MQPGELEIIAGQESLRLDAVEPAFGDEARGEVVVFFDAPSTVNLHVYAREIADGDVMCSLGARRAAVRMDLALAARIVSEALREGLRLPEADAEALRSALGSR